MNSFKQCFIDLSSNRHYSIPVIIFIFAPLLFLFSPITEYFISVGLALQIISLIWLLIVGSKNKYVKWPIILFGLILLIIAIMNTDTSDYSFKEAKRAYASGDYYNSKKQLLDITYKKIIDSKEYTDLKNKIEQRVKEKISSDINKSKQSIKENRFEEANNYIVNILDIDKNNSEALSLAKEIKDLENKQKARLEEQRVRTEEQKAKLEEQRKSLENRKIISFKYTEAKKLHESGDYYKSIKILEEALAIDSNHQPSKNLLLLNNQKRGEFFKKIGLYILFGIVIIVFLILRGLFNTKNENISERQSDNKNDGKQKKLKMGKICPACGESGILLALYKCSKCGMVVCTECKGLGFICPSCKVINAKLTRI